MCKKMHSNKEKANPGAVCLYGVPVIAYSHIFMHDVSPCNGCSGDLETESADRIFWEYGNTNFSQDVDATTSASIVLDEKTVIPFCTHGGSGQSGTYKKIQELCSGADTLPGFAVSDENVKTKATQKKLKSWLKRIDVDSR